MTSFEQQYYEAESFWADGALLDPGNIARINGTTDLVPSGICSLLDVGCGNGIFCHTLIKRRPEIEVFGLDRSEAALRHVRVPHKQGSIESMPFDDCSFDCVSCLQVIEHLPNSIYDKALHELARTTRRFVIIGVPYREDLKQHTTTCPQCKTVFNINLHFRNYDDETLKSLFVAEGGRLVAQEYPTRRFRAKFVNEIAQIGARRTDKQQFLSPICPLCGYTEGDKTPLSAPPPPPARSKSGPLGTIRKSAKFILSKSLPGEEVLGYWVVCLYEFQKPHVSSRLA